MIRDPGTEGMQGHRDDLFRLLVASVKDYAIFVLDPQGYVLTWNEGAQRIKGYTADEILGKHFSIFYPPEEVGRGKLEHELRVATDEGRWEEEGWRLRKDGQRFWASVVLTALYDVHGTLVGFAKVTRDLTERKRAEEERAKLLELEQAARAEAQVAEARLRAQDAFLAVAAHELKTPLTSAKIAAQILHRRYAEHATPELARLQRPLETIDLQLERLSRIVTQLLETVRLQAEQFTLHRAPMNLVELVNDVAERERARTERHDLVVAAKGPAWAYADALRLEQVVVNLLDNAIKFSPEGGRIDVEVTRPTAGTVRLTVRDRGIGVPLEHRPHLFERFHQAHAESYQSGIGLGLYISREIVKQHGGEIRADFPPDGGTCFIVLLPTGFDESPLPGDDRGG